MILVENRESQPLETVRFLVGLHGQLVTLQRTKSCRYGLRKDAGHTCFAEPLSIPPNPAAP